jgi:hypothetical protein
MNWLHIGTSPSVLEYLPRARLENRIDRTITCNAGIKLDPRPDYYACVDFPSQRMFNEHARAAQKGGTHLITLKRTAEALRKRDCDWFDEFVDMPNGPPTREKWGEFRYTGPMCMEYAIRHGASSLILVGCDGYTGKNDYFDGWTDGKQEPVGIYERMTVEVLQPAIQRLVSLWPEVQWLVYGRPVYAIRGDNWRVIGTGLGSLEEP